MPLRPFVIGHSSFRVTCDLRHWALVIGPSLELGPWNLVLPHEMRHRSSDVTIQRFNVSTRGEASLESRAAELTAEARKASARMLVSRPNGDVEFIISHFTDDVSLLNLATEFAGGSPVQKTHFPADMIKKIGPSHIYHLFG